MPTATSANLDIDVSPGRPPMAQVSTADPVAWVTAHREDLQAAVAQHGSVLVRGLGLADAATVDAAFRAYRSELLPDLEAFAKRTAYADGIYSSSTWPAAQPMCMHHELSYTLQPPATMLFACLTAAESGGATGVSDSRAVLAALPDELVSRFERTGWMLVRTYNDEMGSSVEDSLGTADPRAVEAYCQANDIEFEWLADGGLRTRQRRPAIVRHPVTGERCWFNQVAFLSEWTLDEDVREFLVDSYGEDGLPFTTRFGDGEPIGAEVIELLNEIYEQKTEREPWVPGDLMIVDNVRCAHSREAYRGAREILVGMADPVRLTGTGTEGPR